MDGIVRGTTTYNLYGPNAPQANIDHHLGVDRLETPCASAQIYSIISERRIDELFNEDITVFFNHVDPDSVLCYWLLANYRPGRFSEEGRARLDQLVQIEDMVDRHGGFYPLDIEEADMRKIAYVFEPILLDITDEHQAIDEVCERLTQYVETRFQDMELPQPDTRFDVLYEGESWIMIQEYGSYARMEAAMLYEDKRILVAVRPNDMEEYDYTIVTNDPELEITGLGLYLNDIDQCFRDTWGGGTTIIGSPRMAHSSIDPNLMVWIMNTYLEENAAGETFTIPALNRVQI